MLDDVKTIPSFWSKEWFEVNYNNMILNDNQKAYLALASRMITKNAPIYKEVSVATMWPWQLIGALHFREGNCNLSACLHNGETIIGTGKLTTLVPKNRGPFQTWQESAIDCISKKNEFISSDDFSIPAQLMRAERHNGFGYRMRNIPSVYVWEATNICLPTGRFISDGSFAENAPTGKSLGIAPILKELYAKN